MTIEEMSVTASDWSIDTDTFVPVNRAAIEAGHSKPNRLFLKCT